ncbi:Transcription factor MYC2 [Dissostichus eleginoides]|uniref:Transcription factor MYC2 n=1 Tax=Dissostichus eleginoides TaxID=100907 RepID=A0AAD9BWP8_DISEL|nr:Transcription factor MYC2 [Dissostichus eleginoides]
MHLGMFHADADVFLMLSMQNNLPGGPVLSPQSLTSPKAMEPSGAELCPLSHCQMSDGMKAEIVMQKQQGGLDLVVVEKLFYSFPTGETDGFRLFAT